MNAVKSFLPGIVWPAVPDEHGARLLALLWQFAQTERWPAEQLLAHQLRQLSMVVAHARQHTRYYRDHLSGADDRPLSTLSDLRELTLLTRRDLQDGVVSMSSDHIPPQYGKPVEKRSSGSTGQPVLVRSTGLDALIWQANALRDHHWHQRDLSLKLAAIRAFGAGAADPPDGSVARVWGAASAAVYETGPAAMLSLNADAATQAAWLLRHKPGYLLTFPNILAKLLDYLEQEKAALPWLRAVLCVGETVTPLLRQRCRAVLNVSIEDVYSSQELGYIALQCPVSGQYHVMAESVLVEVLDVAGNPCAPGETGRMVISSLHNYAMPLIRYELGDYATVGNACTCGRTLPVLERIAGRERNMLRLPGGKWRWPVVGVLPYSEVAPVRQFKIIQRSLEELEVNFVTDRDLTDGEEARLGAMIIESLGHPFRLNIACVREDFPRAPNGKFEEFVCAIP